MRMVWCGMRDKSLVHFRNIWTVLLAGSALTCCATPNGVDRVEPEQGRATTNTYEGEAKMPSMQIDVRGSGDTPMVLVGGGLTGWASWVPHQQRLSDERRVVRAQPLSVQYGLENRHLPADYSIDVESSALAAALEELGDKPIDLVAWSYGALISLDYALDHPTRIRTLTLIEPPAFWVLTATETMDPQSQKESNELRALHAEMKDEVTKEQLTRFLDGAGLIPPGGSAEDIPSWPTWVEHRRSLRTGDAVWQHRDDAARLRAFDRPVLLLKGTGSTHALHRIIDTLGDTMPNATVLELPGGHAPHIVSIDQFLPRLTSFQSTPD